MAGRGCGRREKEGAEDEEEGETRCKKGARCGVGGGYGGGGRGTRTLHHEHPVVNRQLALVGGVRTTRVRLHENANKRVGGADSSPSVCAVESDTNKSAMALMGFGRLGR